MSAATTTTPPLVARILESMNREVLNQLDLAGSIGHPGENGRAREQIVAAYLRRIVPASFGIDTGFVFDARGDISRQVDLVIYRTTYHPVFEIGGVKHFQVESVVAVIENKASITSRATLTSALENIASVKSLDRTNGGQNDIVGRGYRASRDKFQDQIFGAIVTERSLHRETLCEAFLRYMGTTRRGSWPNIYVDLRSLSLQYIGGSPEILSSVPSEATHLAVTDPSADQAAPPLVDLTFELLNFLRVTNLIDYLPTGYFNAGPRKLARWPLPPDNAGTSGDTPK